MHNRHAWNEKTEDGEKRYVEARKFAGAWKLRSKIGRNGEWEKHDPPAVADLETLLVHLENKYQRRRASYDDIKSVQQLITHYYSS